MIGMPEPFKQIDVYNNYSTVGSPRSLSERYKDLINLKETEYDVCTEIVRKVELSKLNVRYYLSGRYKGIYLTARERDVFLLLIEGYRLKNIAAILSLSVRTIEEYAGFLRKKFNFKFNRDLVTALSKEQSIFNRS